MTPPSRGGDVLVVGGYGAVGSILTRQLAREISGRVIVAGRDLEAATAFAADVGNARGAHVDLADMGTLVRVLNEFPVAVMILAVEPDSAAVAQLSLERGVHVVDVSASADLLTQTEHLHHLAVEHGATAIVSVGLAPGLTNLLARRAADSLPAPSKIDINILLGGGEQHGQDAVRWTVRQLQTQARQPGVRPIRVELPGFRPRRAYPFPFSDQYTLRRTLGVPHIVTRLCFDSAASTTLLFGAQRAGVFRLAQGRRALAALTNLLGRFHVGSDRFAVRVDAQDRDGRRAWHAVTGNRQSRATGLVAAAVAARLLHGDLPLGVHHLDELSQFHQLPEELVPDLELWHDAATRA